MFSNQIELVHEHTLCSQSQGDKKGKRVTFMYIS